MAHEQWRIRARRRAVFLGRALFFLFVTCGPSSLFEHRLYGQTGERRFNRISLDQGLSQVQVNCLMQDRRGYMWLGTKDGLNRYDGYEINVFKTESENPASLSDNWILALAEDSDGLIWVGTMNGLNAYHPKTGRVTRYFHDPRDPNSLRHNTVNALLLDHGGALWVGTGKGLLQFDREANRFTRVSADLGGVYCLLEDSSGSVWAGGYRGLYVVGPDRKTWSRLASDAADDKSLSQGAVRSIVEDDRERLWVGVGESLNALDLRAFRQTGAARFMRVFNWKGVDVQTPGAVYALYFDRGAIWVGVERQGLHVYNSVTGQMTRYLNDPADPKSLAYNSVFAIMQDRGGLMWLATSGGGACTLDPNRRFEYWGYRVNVDRGLPNPRVYAVLKDSAGILWVGTDGGGAVAFDSDGRRAGHVTHNSHDPNSLSHAWVRSLAEDDRGTLWLGSLKGLNALDLHAFRENAEAAQVQRFGLDSASNRDLSESAIYELYYSPRHGRLWVGAEGVGLAGLDPATRQVVRYRHDPADPNSLGSQEVRAIHPGPPGRPDALWVGFDGGGLDLFDPSENRFEHFRHHQAQPNSLSHDHVIALYQDGQGLLWIGTRGGGLNRFDYAVRDFRHFREDETDLPNDTVYGILEDRQGHLWLSTNQGLSKFDPVAENFTNYTVEDGLQGSEFNTGASFKTKEGKLFFGGLNGLTGFWPSDIEPNHNPPNVIVTDIIVDHRSTGIEPESPKNPQVRLLKRLHS